MSHCTCEDCTARRASWAQPPAVEDVLMALHYAVSTAEIAAHDLASTMQREERNAAYEEAVIAIRALAGKETK